MMQEKPTEQKFKCLRAFKCRGVLKIQLTGVAARAFFLSAECRVTPTPFHKGKDLGAVGTGAFSQGFEAQAVGAQVLDGVAATVEFLAAQRAFEEVLRNLQ
jgi:hypothetical protein